MMHFNAGRLNFDRLNFDTSILGLITDLTQPKGSSELGRSIAGKQLWK